MGPAIGFETCKIVNADVTAPMGILETCGCSRPRSMLDPVLPFDQMIIMTTPRGMAALLRSEPKLCLLHFSHSFQIVITTGVQLISCIMISMRIMTMLYVPNQLKALHPVTWCTGHHDVPVATIGCNHALGNR